MFVFNTFKDAKNLMVVNKAVFQEVLFVLFYLSQPFRRDLAKHFNIPESDPFWKNVALVVPSFPEKPTLPDLQYAFIRQVSHVLLFSSNEQKAALPVILENGWILRRYYQKEEQLKGLNPKMRKAYDQFKIAIKKYLWYNLYLPEVAYFLSHLNVETELYNGSFIQQQHFIKIARPPLWIKHWPFLVNIFEVLSAAKALSLDTTTYDLLFRIRLRYWKLTFLIGYLSDVYIHCLFYCCLVGFFESLVGIFSHDNVAYVSNCILSIAITTAIFCAPTLYLFTRIDQFFSVALARLLSLFKVLQ